MYGSKQCREGEDLVLARQSLKARVRRKYLRCLQHAVHVEQQKLERNAAAITYLVAEEQIPRQQDTL
jgi:hypothetical protein